MDDFDRSFRRTQMFIFGVGVFAVGLTVALLAFGGWVVVILLKHFGVV